jgi:hypothetical protein
VWTLCPFIELGTKHPWKKLQRQSLELRWKDWPSRDCCARGSIHNQPPKTDTIVYASKILLKGLRYSCLFWGYAEAWQTQKWMLIVSYWMDHRASNGGARESTQRAKGVWNPIGWTTIWTNQYPPPPPQELVSLAEDVSEDGIVGHQWKERPIGLANFILLSTGECQGQVVGVGM